MLVALISAIDGLSLLYQRLQTKLHYGFVDILGPWLQYTANLCFSTANTPPIVLLFIRYRIVVFSPLLIAGLSFFTGLSFSLRLFTALFPFVLLPDCRFPFVSSPPFFPSFYFRIVVFPFVLLLDCRFYQIVVFPYVILPDCRSFYRIDVVSFVILPDCRSFYRIVIVSFVLLPLFPSSYY